MRGYFAIGVEGISKPMNVGAVLRTAHAFGAAFAFTVAPATREVDFGWANTSDAAGSVPLYHYRGIDDLLLPHGCRLVGIELTDDSIDLPSFRHPARAAYLLGSERLGLSDAAAFAGGAAAAVAGSAWIGLLAAVAVSVSFALVHGFRLDHPSRQPDHLRRRDQLHRSRVDDHSRPGLVQAGRGARRRLPPKAAASPGSTCHSQKR